MYASREWRGEQFKIEQVTDLEDLVMVLLRGSDWQRNRDDPIVYWVDN
jgi:hypothetical protein